MQNNPNIKKSISMAVRDRINDQLRKLLFIPKCDKVLKSKDKRDGPTRLRAYPYICIICDTILKYNDVEYARISTLERASSISRCNWNKDLPDGIVNYYKYESNGKKSWMKDCLLSPQGCYVPTADTFVCCNSCACAVRSKIPKVPPKAIVNLPKGRAPKVLTDLTEIELAFISPVQGFGHFIMYEGGANRKLQRFHSFMKVDLQHVMDTSRSMVECFSVNNISVVLTGPYTKNQRKVIEKSISIRLNKCLEGLNWLIKKLKLFKRKRVERFATAKN